MSLACSRLGGTVRRPWVPQATLCTGLYRWHYGVPCHSRYCNISVCASLLHKCNKLFNNCNAVIHAGHGSLVVLPPGKGPLGIPCSVVGPARDGSTGDGWPSFAAQFLFRSDQSEDRFLTTFGQEVGPLWRPSGTEHAGQHVQALLEGAPEVVPRSRSVRAVCVLSMKNGQSVLPLPIHTRARVVRNTGHFYDVKTTILP